MNLLQRFLVIFVISLFITACDPTFVAHFQTWYDQNEDGIWDDGEPPLEGVEIDNPCGSIITNYKGQCEANCIGISEGDVEAIPPKNYHLTTLKNVYVKSGNYDEENPLRFGFGLDPGVPTPTPHPKTVFCKFYDQYATKIKIAPNGSVWAATGDGLATFIPENDSWQEFPAGYAVYFDDLTIDPDGTAWVVATGCSRNAVARLDDNGWTVFKGENLIATSLLSLGETNDGTQWFTNRCLSGILMGYNPSSGEGIYYYGYHQIEEPKQARISHIGDTWMAAFADEAALDPPPETALPGWEIFELREFSQSETRRNPLDPPSHKMGVISPDDKIWLIGTFIIIRYDTINDKWDTVELPASLWEYGSFLSPTGVDINEDGTVWLAMNGYDESGLMQVYLLRYTQGGGDDLAWNWEMFTVPDGLPEADELLVTADPDGSLWLIAYHYDEKKLIAHCEIDK